MKSAILLAVVAVLSGGAAQAQSPAPGRGYAEGVAQSAFGNATSQSYGAEVGVTVTSGLQIFVEGGQTRTVTTSDIETSAKKIAGGLTSSQGTAVGYSVKQPVTFFVGGVRYLVPMSGKAQPYVLGGFGVAQAELRLRQDRTRPRPSRASWTPASQRIVLPMPASPESTSARGPCATSARNAWTKPSSSSRPTTALPAIAWTAL